MMTRPENTLRTVWQGQSEPLESRRTAVLIPCFNEERTIEKVVRDFQRELPGATIYVYDNNSSDRTVVIARSAGAVVRHEKRQGKGWVISSMFEQVEADLYLLVDGDDTYPAEKAHEILGPLLEGKADMVVGTRLEDFSDKSFRPFHLFGNRMIVRLVNMLFKSNLKDIMSGYRAINADFVKKVPVISKGFEVETQMTLQALFYDFVIAEVPVPYRRRPEGSYSKLNTFSDGIRTILTIFDIFKAYRPLLFFFIIGAVLACAGLLIGSVPVLEFFQTGKITHFPSALLASGIVIISVICVSMGIILDAINHRLRELMRIINVNRHDRAPRDQRT
ncbi:MAG: glycosyltransferase family 2 protein [Desulfobacterales bacterium]|nr:glycosyltransferase family 2 protein [Desulfobacterales bacterium]